MPKQKREGHDLEAPLVAELRLALGSRRDMKLFRLNTGKYRAMWDPKVIVTSAPAGTPDLLGCWRRDVKPVRGMDFIGYAKKVIYHGKDNVTAIGIGQFFAIETKARYGRQSQEQKDWQSAWESVGAIYLLARTVEQVLEFFGPDRGNK